MVDRPKPHCLWENGRWCVFFSSKFMIAFGLDSGTYMFPSHGDAMKFVKAYYQFPHLPPISIYIWMRDGGICHICKRFIYPEIDKRHYWGSQKKSPTLSRKDAAMSIDHLIARKDGGSNDLENLKSSHQLCNESRHQEGVKVRLKAMHAVLNEMRANRLGPNA